MKSPMLIKAHAVRAQAISMMLEAKTIAHLRELSMLADEADAIAKKLEWEGHR